MPPAARRGGAAPFSTIRFHADRSCADQYDSRRSRGQYRAHDSPAREASGRGAEIVVFPELAITGYPPRDLVEKPSFLERTEEQLARLAAETAALPPPSSPATPAARIPPPASAPPTAPPSSSAAASSSADQNAAAHLRRLRRGPLLRSRRSRRSCDFHGERRSRSPSARMPGTTSSTGSAASTAATRLKNSRAPARRC